jgi:hypothetical protein
MITLQFSSHATTSGVKEITHGGRRYLVSPVVALREGILNGIYVGAAEFGKFAQSWAGRPIPISHPKADGLHTTANTPDIWANDVLGHFWNVEVANGALKGEIWIDLDKAQLMGERAISIVNRLRAQEQMEVSTAYFCDMEVKSGTWGGQSYTGVAHNIRPDHLAILPDEAGACSWADGCGTPRVNAQEQSMDESTLIQRFLGWLKNSQSEIFSSTSIEEGIVSLNTDLDGLVAGQNALDTNVPKQENLSMGKAELIGALCANAKCKFSKDKLDSWDEADLTSLSQSLATNDEAEEVAAPETPTTAPTAQDGDLIARIATLEELIKGLTANTSEERAGLIAAIVPNCRGAWSAAELGKMDIAKLRQVHGSYMPRDYSANAGAYRDMSGPEDEELLMHWPMFEKGA